METAAAEIRTDRPQRYLDQLCRHATSMGTMAGHRPRLHRGEALARREVQLRADRTEDQAVLTFDPWGTCTVTVATNGLTLHVEATDEEDLHLIQDIVTKDLERFGRRERLTVSWHRLTR